MSEEEHVCTHDPLGYLRFAYQVEHNVPIYPAVAWIVKELPQLLEIFVPEGGGSLIDIGCGGTLHNAASFSAKFTDLYLAEYQESARNLLQETLKGSAQFDWSPFYSIVGQNEKEYFLHIFCLCRNHIYNLPDPKSCDEVKKRLEERIKAICYCDIRSQHCGIEPDIPTVFDAVASFGVVSVASNNLDEYKEALDNLLSLLKPGGLLFYNDITSSSHKEEGQLAIVELEYKELVQGKGIQILYWDTVACDDAGVSEFILVGKKMA